MACLSLSQTLRNSKCLANHLRLLNSYSTRLHNLQGWPRSKSSVAASRIELKEKQEASQYNLMSHETEYHSQPKDPLDLTFSNTKEAYKSKTTSELIRALLVLKLSSYDVLINNHAKVGCP